MLKSGIYKIINVINNHIYIGSATNISSRWGTHKHRLRENKHHSRYLQRAYNKYGDLFFQYEVIEYVSVLDLIIREQFWIDKLNPSYNMVKTAGNCLGYKHTKASNKKKSLNHAMRGKFGVYHNSSKVIYQYSSEGNFIKRWDSLRDIERILNIETSNIPKAIQRRGTVAGYIWSYKDCGKVLLKPQKVRDRSSTCKAIIGVSTKDSSKLEFKSIKEAHQYFRKNSGNIDSVLKGLTKTAYGYVWKYKEII